MKRTYSLLLLTAFVAAGCSTPAHRCPLDGSGGPECRSMAAGYLGAVNTPVSSAGLDDLPTYALGTTAQAKQSGPLTFQGYSQPRQAGRPVFEQAQVHRAWTAPWTDAEGVLHGGEYVYFTTPGKWSYGTLTAPGGSSDIFRPLHPEDLGINPVYGAEARAMEAEAKAKPVPAQAQPAAGAGQATAATAAQAAATAHAGVQVAPQGITQPYERLSIDQ